MDPRSADYLKAESNVAKKSPYKANWLAQFRAVLWRSWTSYIKDPLVLKVQIFQTIAVALVIGLTYYGQEFNQDGIQNISGVLFLLLTQFTVANLFGVLDVFCIELPVFLREHFNGMYRTDVYFLTKMLAELPFFVILPGVFVTICYFLIGLKVDSGAFWETVLILTLVANCAVSIGYLLSCFAKSITVALAIAPPVMLPLMLVGGFFLHSGSIPFYLAWIKHISWFYYGNEALAISQWSRVDSITCNRDPITCPPNGKIILKVLDFHTENFMIDICALFGLIFFYRLLAYFALLLQTFRKN